MVVQIGSECFSRSDANFVDGGAVATGTPAAESIERTARNAPAYKQSAPAILIGATSARFAPLPLMYLHTVLNRLLGRKTSSHSSVEPAIPKVLFKYAPN